MPYIADDDDKDKSYEEETAVQISGASPTTEASGGVQAPINANGEKKLNTGSGYQNLDQYLQANSGAHFGDQLVGKVQGDVDQAQKNIQSEKATFEDKIKSPNATPTSEQVNSAIANPTSVAPSQYQSWINQQYQGPTSVSGEDYNNLWKGTNDANTKAGYLSTEPGRFTLLDSYFGRPDYTQGQKSLDNLLVQNQEGIGSSIQNTQTQANQLKPQAQNTQTDLQNQITAQQAAVQDSAQNARNAIGIDANGQVITDPNAVGYGAIGKQYSQIQNSLASENAARQAQNKQLQTDLANGRLTEEEQKLLGLSNQSNIYGLNLKDYFKAGSDLNANQIITPEQQAQIEALNQLAGSTNIYGGALASKTDPFAFDAARFKGDQAATEKGYQAALTQAYAPISKLQASGLIPANATAQQLLEAITQKKASMKAKPTSNPQVASGNDYYLYILQQALDNVNKVNSDYKVDRKIGIKTNGN